MGHYPTAFYIRLSREDGDKEESDSVSNQKKLLTGYMDGCEELYLYDIYIDDGYTGTNFDRPGFRRMMEDIQSGNVKCVLVKDLSRFGRDYIDTGRYLERIFPELGVRFISVTDGIDSVSHAYDMLLPIKNIFNEQYARDISRKIQATMKSKQKAGEFIGAFACYGYKKSSVNRNKLVIDEAAAENVRKVFELFADGKSKQEIADIFNKEGILSPSEYKRRNGENYRNGNRVESSRGWTYSTIHQMLGNEIYTGSMVQGKKHQNMRSRQRTVAKKDWIIVQGTHEPVVSREIWDKTRKLLKQNRKKASAKYEENIFSGLIFCGDCKKNMILNHWKRSDGTISACFYCGTYKRKGRGFCTPHKIPADILKKIITKEILNLWNNSKKLEDLVKTSLQLNEQEENRRRRREFQNAEACFCRLQNLKKSAYEDYRDNLISKEEFISYSQNYVEKMDFFKKRMELLKDQEYHEEKEISSREFIEQLQSRQLDRRLLQEMISCIYIYKDKCLEIVYSFCPENMKNSTD